MNLFDYSVISFFFLILLILGFISVKFIKNNSLEYLIYNRKLGLYLFIFTNVSVWYGGILGISEMTYNYGLLSWFTQGLPYYIFAFLFALLLAKKIRESEVITIPQKILKVYGKNVSLLVSVYILFLVNPAPYFLMLSKTIMYVLDTNIIFSFIIIFIATLSYQIFGGFKSNVFTDAFQFFIMFLGFILALIFSVKNLGGIDFLISNLPPSHLTLTGNANIIYIIVWFMIALWTFVDPGFHQRTNAAATSKIAVKGILISIVLWFIFDFLTNSFGLYARAAFKNLQDPSYSFYYLADKILPAGFRGLFYAGIFATIISTFNSFLFLGASTFAIDLIGRYKDIENKQTIIYTRIGLVVTIIIAAILSLVIPSVIDLWYLIGSFFIPGLIFPVLSSYYKILLIKPKLMVIEMILGFISSVFFFFIKNTFNNTFLNNLEPMLAGIITVTIYHLIILIWKNNYKEIEN